MTGQEIERLITFNNKKIEEMLDPSTFVLKPEVSELLEENTPKNNDPAANPQSQNQPNQSKSQKNVEENKKLRGQCPHVFEHGICVFCGTTRED